MYDGAFGIIGAACFTGMAVKLMDDRLDEPLDSLLNRPNLTRVLGRADIAYALLSLTLAVALSPVVALVLFAASYAVGMAHEPGRTGPLGLPYWAESAGILAVGVLKAGVGLQAAALLGVGAVQLVDDIRDRREGSHQLPIASRFGLTERVMVAALATIGGMLLDPLLVFSIFATYFVYEAATVRRR